MLKKDENFHSTCQTCNKLIPNQHFNCEREMLNKQEQSFLSLINSLEKLADEYEDDSIIIAKNYLLAEFNKLKNMREIKFRGKRIDNGEWVYGYYFKSPLTNETGEADSFLSGEQKHQIADEFGCVFEIDVNTLGQFTGLLDKNGKEVFEGDVISHGFLTLIVKFNENEACFGLWNENRKHWGYWNDTDFNKDVKTREIIGNIHSDPKLLIY